MARLKLYYPVDEITPNLYTSGQQWMTTDNKEYVGENKISIESFKSMITCIVSSSNYTEKGKKCAIEFVGFKWKQIEVKPIDNLEIENIIIEKIKKVNKKKLLNIDSS